MGSLLVLIGRFFELKILTFKFSSLFTKEKLRDVGTYSPGKSDSHKERQAEYKFHISKDNISYT